MKKTINFIEFCDEFERMGRGKQFTYGGLKLLFTYLEELETDTGEEIELDVIAFCCDYVEYKSIKDLKRESDLLAECNNIEEIRDKLDHHTSVICCEENCIVFQCF